MPLVEAAARSAAAAVPRRGARTSRGWRRSRRREEERHEEEPDAPGPMPAVIRVRIGIRVRPPRRGSDDLAALLDAVCHARLVGPEADHGGEQQRADEHDPTMPVVHESILLSSDKDAPPLWSDYGDAASLATPVVSSPVDLASQQERTVMKIAIIGTGSVGSALGVGSPTRRHDVVFGVRDTSKPEVGKLLEEAGAGAAAVVAAASDAEVVVLALPWDAAQDVIRSAGGLSGKIVLDCINPLKPDLAGLDTGDARSAAEQVAAWAPEARVVKIFNTTGANNMANPVYGNDHVTMLPIQRSGPGSQEGGGATRRRPRFEPVDAGPLSVAYLLEHFAMLWIHLAYRARGWGGTSRSS